MAEAFFGLLGVIVGCLVTIYLSHISQRTSMKLANIEKKLQVHQDAYRNWSYLLSTLYNPVLRQAVYRQCLHWWDSNCLYLEEKVRKEFYIVLRSVPSFQPRGKQTKEDEEIIRRANALLDLIAASVGLPPTGTLPLDFKKEGKFILGSFDPMTIIDEVNEQFDHMGHPIKKNE